MVSEVVTHVIIPNLQFYEEFHQQINIAELNPMWYNVINVISITEATVAVKTESGVEYQYRICVVGYNPDTRETIVLPMEEVKIYKSRKTYGYKHGASDRTGQAKKKGDREKNR